MSLLVKAGVDLRGSWRGIDVCDNGGIACVCNHLMTQWIDPVPSVERNTNGILMVIGTEAHHWLQPRGGWCWHFHPISTAYRHQRKRNFEICLHGEKEGEKPEGKERRVSSVTFSDQQASSFWDFIHSNTHSATTHTHTHARFLVNRHAHEYLRRTEASFPVLLYLMHIKYHFPQKIPQCLIFVGRREILSWLPSTGYYQKLDFITDSSYVFGKSKETQRRQMKRLRWKNNMYGHYFFHVVKSLN